MKTCLKFLIPALLILSAPVARAFDITLQWTHDAAAQQATQYKLYHTEDKTKWLNFYPVDPAASGTAQQKTIAVPTADTWYRVTAVNASGESVPSNEVLFKFLPIPSAPGSLIILLN